MCLSRAKAPDNRLCGRCGAGDGAGMKFKGKGMEKPMDFWRNGRTAGAKTGVVTTGGPEIAVRTDMERRAPVVAVPFGMAVCVPQGEKVVMLPESGVCLGTVNGAAGLKPGEVRLFSAGGAEILLRADGAVVINGQVFPGKVAGDGD